MNRKSSIPPRFQNLRPRQPQLLHPMMPDLSLFESINANWAARILTSALQGHVAEEAHEIMAQDRAQYVAQRIIREGQASLQYTGPHKGVMIPEVP